MDIFVLITFGTPSDDGLKKLPPGALSPSKCGCGGHNTGGQCTSAASGSGCSNKARAADQRKKAGGRFLDGREGGKGAATRNKPRTPDQDKKQVSAGIRIYACRRGGLYRLVSMS